jgi:hypothetical protein
MISSIRNRTKKITFSEYLIFMHCLLHDTIYIYIVSKEKIIDDHFQTIKNNQ